MDFFGGSGLSTYDSGWSYALPPAPGTPGTMGTPVPCDNAWCAITNGLNAAANAYGNYLQNDTANEALARNQSVSWRTGPLASVGGLSGLNISGLLPILLVIAGIALLFRLVRK